MVGVVETPAPADSSFARGNVVVVVPNYPCRRCYSCRRGLINLCDEFDHAGATSDGGLAELLWVPDEFLHRVPDGLEPAVAALAEPLACVLNAVVRINWQAGEPVLVLGGGPIGLLFAAVAKLSGSGPVIVSEPNPARAALALAVGADHVVDPLQPEALNRLSELLGGNGAPIVFDALGSLLSTALHLVAKGGSIYIFGVNQAAQVTFKPAEIVDKEVNVFGVYIAKGTFPRAIRLLAAHPDVFGRIVSDSIPLADWGRARDLLMSGTAAGKILVTMARVG
jgi:threonine dehydrogenase-like Zn-dependent dehydrogenase